MNSVGIQFIGGIADGDKIQAEDKYSVDKFVYVGEWVISDAKELVEQFPTADGKATDKDLANKGLFTVYNWT